ncbi:MAG: protein kinase, partial [Myxococcota bacterium]
MNDSSDESRSVAGADNVPFRERIERSPPWTVSKITGRSSTIAETASERPPLRLGAIAPTATQAPPETLDGDYDAGALVNQYELIRELGRGGMGAVFLARDTWLGRLVALKFLSGPEDNSADKLIAEARATARCVHENIVVIHEVGEHDGRSFMVLEYLKGQTLRTWFERRKPVLDGIAIQGVGGLSAREPVPAGLAVEMMVPVVQALVCAHRMGIVHRDLKPENVFLTESGTIKVLDFGLAKRLPREISLDSTPIPEWFPELNHTRPGVLVGTLPYMAPEQWRTQVGETDDGRIDPRTDLWTIGIMLFELLAGHHPLAPLSPEVLRGVGDLNTAMPSLSELRPDLPRLGPIVDRCLRKRKDQRMCSAEQLLAEIEPLLPARRLSDAAGGDRPFTGLAAFQESDSSRFFGRDNDVAGLVASLRSRALVTVAGPSGAGKSSLIRAGVIPALRRSGEGWQPFIIRPGRQPLAALADLLGQVMATDATPTAPQTHEDLIATLRVQPGYLGAQLRAWARKRRLRIVLFIDQFEELYTLVAESALRAAFAACVDGAADDVSSPVRVIACLRSDFIDRLAEERSIMGQVIAGLELLAPIAPDGLREALVRPTEAVGYRFEDAALVEQMLDELKTTSGPLPLLQFTAAMLWARRDRQRQMLTWDSYRAIGGIAGALATHADAVVAGMSAAERDLARAILMRLVTPERTRAIVELAELPDGGQHGGNAGEQVIRRLTDARLVVLENGMGDGRAGATVELIHESLIERWPTLVRWLEENTEDAEFLSRLRSASAQWESSGHTEGLLWSGRAAVDAQRWLERQQAAVEPSTAPAAALSKRDRRYLRAVATQAQQTQRRRRLLMVGSMVMLSVIAVLLTVFAVRANSAAVRAHNASVRAGEQAERADEEAERALHEAIVARNATRMAIAREMQSDPTAVLAIVREVEPESPPRGWAALARWALHSGVAEVVIPHDDWIHSAAFSPDGARIVSASRDSHARVWNADGSGQPLVLRGHDDEVRWAEFDHTGRRIVTASSDMTARVWNADGSGQPVVLSGHGERVISAAFSRDSKRVVTASSDHTVRIWNSDGSGRPVVLRGHSDVVFSARFNSDGSRVVSASSDRTVRVWNADGSGSPLVLTGHDARVNSAEFSRDDRRIVTASSDKTARIWNADGSGEPIVVRGHSDEVYTAQFSSDDKRIVTASYDQTIGIWNADGSGQPIILRGHDQSVM